MNHNREPLIPSQAKFRLYAFVAVILNQQIMSSKIDPTLLVLMNLINAITSSSVLLVLSKSVSTDDLSFNTSENLENVELVLLFNKTSTFLKVAFLILTPFIAGAFVAYNWRICNFYYKLGIRGGSEIVFQHPRSSRLTGQGFCQYCFAFLLSGGLGLWLTTWINCWSSTNKEILSILGVGFTTLSLVVQAPILFLMIFVVPALNTIGFSFRSYNEIGHVKFRSAVDLLYHLKTVLLYIAIYCNVLRNLIQYLFFSVIAYLCYIEVEILDEQFWLKNNESQFWFSGILVARITWNTVLIICMVMKSISNEFIRFQEFMLLYIILLACALRVYINCREKQKQKKLNDLNLTKWEKLMPVQIHHLLDICDRFGSTFSNSKKTEITLFNDDIFVYIISQYKEHQKRCVDPTCKCKTSEVQLRPSEKVHTHTRCEDINQALSVFKNVVADFVLRITQKWCEKEITNDKFSVVLRSVELDTFSLIAILNYERMMNKQHSEIKKVLMNLEMLEFSVLSQNPKKNLINIEDADSNLNFRFFHEFSDSKRVRKAIKRHIRLFGELYFDLSKKALHLSDVQSRLIELHKSEVEYKKMLPKLKDTFYIGLIDYKMRSFFKIESFRGAKYQSLKNWTLKNLEGKVGNIANSKFDSRTEFIILKITSQGNLKITNVSSHVNKLTGYPTKVLIGMNLMKLMPENMSESHNSIVINFLKTGVSNIIGKTKSVFVINANNEIVPVDVLVNYGIGVSGMEMIFYSSLKLNEDHKNMFLCNNQGLVLNSTTELTKIINLPFEAYSQKLPITWLLHKMTFRLTEIIQKDYLVAERDSIFSHYKENSQVRLVDEFISKNRLKSDIDELQHYFLNLREHKSKQSLIELINRFFELFQNMTVDSSELRFIPVRTIIRVMHYMEKKYIVVTIVDDLGATLSPRRVLFKNCIFRTVLLKCFVRKWLESKKDVGFKRMNTQHKVIRGKNEAGNGRISCLNLLKPRRSSSVALHIEKQTSDKTSNGWIEKKLSRATESKRKFNTPIRIVFFFTVIIIPIIMVVHLQIDLKSMEFVGLNCNRLLEMTYFAKAIGFLNSLHVQREFASRASKEISAVGLKAYKTAMRKGISELIFNPDYTTSENLSTLSVTNANFGFTKDHPSATEETASVSDASVYLSGEIVPLPQNKSLISSFQTFHNPLLDTLAVQSKINFYALISNVLTSMSFSDSFADKALSIEADLTLIWQNFQLQVYKNKFTEIAHGAQSKNIMLWVIESLILGLCLIFSFYFYLTHKRRVEFISSQIRFFREDTYGPQSLLSFTMNLGVQTKKLQMMIQPLVKHFKSRSETQKIIPMRFVFWRPWAILTAALFALFVLLNFILAISDSFVTEKTKKVYILEANLKCLEMMVGLKTLSFLRPNIGLSLTFINQEADLLASVRPGTSVLKNMTLYGDVLDHELNGDVCLQIPSISSTSCNTVFKGMKARNFDMSFNFLMSKWAVGESIDVSKLEQHALRGLFIGLYLNKFQTKFTQYLIRQWQDSRTIMNLSILSIIILFLIYGVAGYFSVIARLETDTTAVKQVFRYISPEKAFTQTKLHNFVEKMF